MCQDKLSEMLEKVRLEGDMRRKAARELETAIISVCDTIADAAHEAGTWGAHIGIIITGHRETKTLAWLRKVDVIAEDGTLQDSVAVAVADTVSDFLKDDGSPYFKNPDEFPLLVTAKRVKTGSTTELETVVERDSFSGRDVERRKPKHLYVSEFNIPPRKTLVSLANHLREIAVVLLKRCETLHKETTDALEKVQRLANA